MGPNYDSSKIVNSRSTAFPIAMQGPIIEALNTIIAFPEVKKNKELLEYCEETKLLLSSAFMSVIIARFNRIAAKAYKIGFDLGSEVMKKITIDYLARIATNGIDFIVEIKP